MQTIYDLKPKFQSLLRPLCNRLAKAGVSANQVTLSALFISLLCGLSLYLFPTSKYALLAVPFVMFIRMALNAIDGMLAREHDMQSNLGAILNELGDVISDTALFIPFALNPNINAQLIVLIVILSLLCEMAGIIAIQIGAQRRYDGPMGKSDRAFIFGLLALLLAFNIATAAVYNGLLIIVSLLLCLSIVNRCKKALHAV